MVVISDKEDYLKETKEQLRTSYEEVTDDPWYLVDATHRILGKIQKRGDIHTLNYFDVEEPKFGRFYPLPRTQKRLHNVPGRPVISNSSFYTFLDFRRSP